MRTIIFPMPLLGPNHVLVNDIQVFNTAFNQRLSQVMNMSWTLKSRIKLPSNIVHRIQICINHWLTSQSSSAMSIQAPGLMSLLEKIELEELWEPSIPPQYTQQFQPPSGTGSVLSELTGTSTLGASVITPPSGGGTEPPKRPPPAGGSQQPVCHPNYNDAVFDKYCQMRLRHPQLLKKVTARPPASTHEPSGQYEGQP